MAPGALGIHGRVGLALKRADGFCKERTARLLGHVRSVRLRPVAVLLVEVRRIVQGPWTPRLASRGLVVSAIDLQVLRGVTKVITHAREDAPCPDGLSAALIVRDALPDVEVQFVRYESREHADLLAEPGLLFVDISPPTARLGEFIDAGTVVLDHHETVQKDVERFAALGLGRYAFEPGVSGATLAYEEVWLPLVWPPLAELTADTRSQMSGFGGESHRERVRRFAELAGIYDTWQTEHVDWPKACELSSVVYFFPPEDWLADRTLFSYGPSLERRMELGPILARKNRDRARDLAASAYRFVTPKGTRVTVCSTTVVSEAANVIEDADVVIGFGFRVREGHPAMKLSFRSRGGYVVRPIAEGLGGGGHRASASAWVELHASHRNPYQVIRTLMDAW